MFLLKQGNYWSGTKAPLAIILAALTYYYNFLKTVDCVSPAITSGSNTQLLNNLFDGYCGTNPKRRSELKEIPN